jgi:regulator of replication initiation timing
MSCTLEVSERFINGLASHIETSGNVSSIVAENLRLQGELDVARRKLSTGTWIDMANEIEALREQNEALQSALKSVHGALEAISGTIAIYRAHQP